MLVDTTPPADITDLAATGGDPLSVSLAWTAPGDDGWSGNAASYDIRYSTAAITEANWAVATRVPNLVPPGYQASPEHFTVYGLQPGTPYYFAVKTTDREGNSSGALERRYGHDGQPAKPAPGDIDADRGEGRRNDGQLPDHSIDGLRQGRT